MVRKIVSSDGVELEARCSGTGSSMVLVHGALSDINTFASIEERLAGRHRVWVYSRRGRGNSGDRPEYSLQREVDDVLAVAEAAGGDIHLVGHSSGAYYCLLAATRIQALRSLVLYEPPLHVDRVDAAFLERMESALRAGHPDAALDAFFPIADLSPEEVRMVKSQAPVWETLRDGVRVFPRESRALGSNGRRMLDTRSIPAVPVLYLHGELTTAPIFPTLDEVTALIPQAQLRCLGGQRHMAQAFSPEAFADSIMAFTAGVDGAS